MVTLPQHHICLICTATESPPQGGLPSQGADKAYVILLQEATNVSQNGLFALLIRSLWHDLVTCVTNLQNWLPKVQCPQARQCSLSWVQSPRQNTATTPMCMDQILIPNFSPRSRFTLSGCMNTEKILTKKLALYYNALILFVQKCHVAVDVV